jgi:hypothetical protein
MVGSTGGHLGGVVGGRGGGHKLHRRVALRRYGACCDGLGLLCVLGLQRMATEVDNGYGRVVSGRGRVVSRVGWQWMVDECLLTKGRLGVAGWLDADRLVDLGAIETSLLLRLADRDDCFLFPRANCAVVVVVNGLQTGRYIQIMLHLLPTSTIITALGVEAASKGRELARARASKRSTLQIH